jgi:hypothetical protein
MEKPDPYGTESGCYLRRGREIEQDAPVEKPLSVQRSEDLLARCAGGNDAPTLPWHRHARREVLIDKSESGPNSDALAQPGIVWERVLRFVLRSDLANVAEIIQPPLQISDLQSLPDWCVSSSRFNRVQIRQKGTSVGQSETETIESASCIDRGS